MRLAHGTASGYVWQTWPPQAPLQVAVHGAAGEPATRLLVGTGPGAWKQAETNFVQVGAATYASEPDRAD